MNPPLPPRQSLAAPGKWPVVGEKAPRASDAPWTLEIVGAVTGPLVFTLDELIALGTETRTIDLHCVTRWSKLNVPFGGVALEKALALAQPSSDARFLSFVARSERNHSTSLPLDDALALGVFLATHADEKPLETIHGGPLRSICPERYFYKSVKWLERIEVLTEDRLGYWESEAGYHNRAEPWAEERYIAPSVAPKILERALASRAFSRLDLRGVELSGRELRGLIARGSLLRDARFVGCDLRGADFTEANLSNAHLDGADLTGARLTDADLEGASLDGANLTGADLSGASLFGTTFLGATGAAAQREEGFGGSLPRPA